MSEWRMTEEKVYRRFVRAQWIPIEEELPRARIDVLTYRGDFDSMQVDSLISDVSEVAWFGTLCRDWDKVTHWMPLPEKPNE